MPRWGNNSANRGNAMVMPNMNWGNNNSGWNVPRWGGQGTTMYMPVPVAPQSPMMRSSAPQGVQMMTMPSMPTSVMARQVAPPMGHGQKVGESAAKPEKVLSASDIVKQKIEEMQTLNKAIADRLLGADKKEVSAETPKAVAVSTEQPQKAEEPAKEEKKSPASDLVTQQVGEMKKLADVIEKKISGEKAEDTKAKEPETAVKE